MPQAADVLKSAGIEAPDPISDDQFTTTCPQCNATQTLAAAEITRDHGGETVYTCEKGCVPLLVVSPPESSEWPGRGYRLGNWVLRNPADIYFKQPSLKAAVLLPASPEALP